MNTKKQLLLCVAFAAAGAAWMQRGGNLEATNGSELVQRRVAGDGAELGHVKPNATWLAKSILKMKPGFYAPLAIHPLAGTGWKGCYVLSARPSETSSIEVGESDWRLYFRILDDGSVIPLASSIGIQSLGGDDYDSLDVFRDVDGDGTDELVCPQVWGADGQTRVDIYRLTGNGSEVCGGHDLVAALCPDFAPTNQTWSGAMMCKIERDTEGFPSGYINPGPLTLFCSYEVPLSPEEVTAGEHAYQSVDRRILLENVRLPFVSYSPSGFGSIAAASSTPAKPAPPEPEAAVSWVEVRQAYEATMDDWEWAEDAAGLFARHGVAGASGTDGQRMLEIRCAAEEGNPGAQLLLGLSYAFGLVPGVGDAESRELAVLWCRLGREGDGQAGFHAAMPILSDEQVRAVADETTAATDAPRRSSVGL